MGIIEGVCFICNVLLTFGWSRYDTDEQRRFDDKYLEELRKHSSHRAHWRSEDNVKMVAWLAHNRQSKSTICSSQMELSKVAKSIGIDPNTLQRRHRIVLKKMMISSMGVSEYWDSSAKVTRLRWPVELVRELTPGVCEMVQTVVGEGANRQEHEPEADEAYVISDDDDDGDFKDWEGDVEMGLFEAFPKMTANLQLLTRRIDGAQQSTSRQDFEVKLVSGLEAFTMKVQAQLKKALNTKKNTIQETAQVQLERARIQWQRREQEQRDSECRRHKQDLDEEDRLSQEKKRKNAKDLEKAREEENLLKQKQVKMRHEYLQKIESQQRDFEREMSESLEQSQLLASSEKEGEKYHQPLDFPAQQQHHRS
ncbi:uncharacterized protein NECHADRAFT_88716 [Fusarium vanettenii 77-13-4]|uniref:Uncharacterized protein n=1 Tax=Fusarium vanettenii (strain ATCC MYA-4622 / CBS 123669 / FGSC 9596 / NRRL 45880 / 77-13-4) TaxID=660122 RepID=C7ZND5_FUSV7|nr:uncharacterized protein NECHADRAFT_88716 [Fusarium vanettenii 77-13-4]EEU34483.1 predicted protein [Fusarium vanettenii 77-13-4]